MTDGSDVENRLFSQHNEQSKKDLTEEERDMHFEFNEGYSFVLNQEEINSNQIQIFSTGPDDHPQNENKEKNNDINSNNHNQIIQNTIINKKRKRNIISEEKKKNMGRKKKDFCSDSTHNKYSEDNQIKKIERNFTNFCPKHVKMVSGGNFEIKKTERERFNRDFYLKLLPSSIEDYFSKKISPKYTKNREPNEETINILKKKYPELKDFFEQTFNDGLKKYINGYYDSMYENPADNKYLFSQLKIDEKEKEIWKRLIDEDLYDYFLKKKGRKTIDKED